ncbi:ABC transporter ATP-binding protein [Leptothermofonsia sp. ETS-13]|uniref:ABC transporter ATP-binding protein n=1 Tax=Leptothermofonsia sp. ETS-13 TaxID=3035696 RepID=UPI003BA09756
MGQSVILQLENISKQFSPNLPPAVSSVSLTLHQGDILGLLGPSGCGKTTLLRLIAGFERPQAGIITLAEQIVADSRRWLPPERRDVGMVFQDYALFPHLTVASNVAFGLKNRRRFRRYSPKQVNHQVEQAIALVGLQGLENRYPHELSGGQQQRVALARAIAPQPALILLDEPLSNLDVQVRLRLRQEVRHILKQTGTSAIFVTHDQEEALSICDRVAVIRHGKIEQLDTPEMIYQEPASRFVAEFVTQANFLPAHWNGQGWETEVGCFRVQAGETGNGKAEPSSISLVELMIRQEDIQLEPDEAGEVVVRDRQFLGREYRYSLVGSSGLELQARTTVEQSLPIGSRVRLSIASTASKIFGSCCSDPA